MNRLVNCKRLVYENPNVLSSENSIKFQIIHFNDVYNIESKTGINEPCGGGIRRLN